MFKVGRGGLCPLWRKRKTPFDVIYYPYKVKQSHWLLCVAKNCDWSRKITPLSNRLSNLTRESLLVEWKLTESRIKLRNIQISKKMLGKSCQFNFCHQSSAVSRKAWTSTLPWILQELKKYPRKTSGYGQPRGHLIRVLNEGSANDGGNFSLLWLVILKSVWCSVGDTFQLQCSWPWAVVATLCSLLCPEPDWNISIGKQLGSVFVLTEFKKRCFDVSFLSVNQCQHLLWDWEKLICLKWYYDQKIISFFSSDFESVFT